MAEFNPFHNGHKYLIDCAKNDGHSVFCVISGNFVQRGDVAVISKFDRARQALLCGADLVAELPCPWSMSTAQNFALGAVSQLSAVGADVLYFGSECGDTELLERAAEVLDSAEFEKRLKENVKGSATFAAVRQKVLSGMDARLGRLLDGPNDTLAIEYIISAKKINPQISFKAVKRIGAEHNAEEAVNGYSTATLIRDRLIQKDTEYIMQFMPPKAAEVLLTAGISDIKRLETAILCRLRSMSLEDLSKLADISEGLENALYSSVRGAVSLKELYDGVKSKRYTLARIRRIILNGFIGIDDSFFKKEPPYVRILGFADNAVSAIPAMPVKPVITRVSQINGLDDFSKKVFETECRATDLYSLSLDKPLPCGGDCVTPIINLRRT